MRVSPLSETTSLLPTHPSAPSYKPRRPRRFWSFGPLIVASSCVFFVFLLVRHSKPPVSIIYGQGCRRWGDYDVNNLYHRKGDGALKVVTNETLIIKLANELPIPPPTTAPSPALSINDFPPRPTKASESISFHLHGYHGPPSGFADNIFRPFPPSSSGNVILPFMAFEHNGSSSSKNNLYPITHMYHHTHLHTTSTAHTLESFDSPQSSVVVEDGLGSALVVDLTSLNVAQGSTRSITGMWKMQNYNPPLPPLSLVEGAESSSSADGDSLYPLLKSTRFLANSKVDPTLTTSKNRIKMVNAGAGDTLVIKVEGDHLVVGRDGVLFPGAARSNPHGNKYVLEAGSRIDMFIFSPNVTIHSDCGEDLDLAWLGKKTDLNCWNGGTYATSGSGYSIFSVITSMTTSELSKSKKLVSSFDLSTYTNPSYYHPSQSLLSAEPVEKHDFVYYTSPDKFPSPPSMIPSSLYGFNGHPYDGQPSSSTVCLSKVYEWKVVNPTSVGHPFHMHTNHFQVVDYECDVGGGCDASPSYSIGDWRDTIMPPSPGSVTIRFKPLDWTGDSFAHCHIFGHEDRGMAVKVRIEDC